MAKKLDLRSKAAPSAQDVSKTTPITGLPLPMGETVNLSPEEREFLEAAGWKDGDPIVDLNEFLAKARQEQTDIVAKMSTSDERLSVPEITSFEDLSDEKQQELIQAFDDLRTKHANAPEAAVVPEGAHPSVAEAIEIASQPSNEGGVEVVDDPSQAVEAPTTESSGWGTELTPDRACPHCGWDTHIKETADISEEDRQSFYMSILGGGRFYKDVNILGQAVTVRLRTITTAEADMALQQTSYDFRDGLIPDQGEFYRVYSNYRLALSIERVSTPAKITDIPVIADIEWDKPEIGEPAQTPIPVLENWLHDNVLTSESLRRIIGMEHQRFQRIVEKLEARVHDPDFWEGIEPSH